VIPIGSKGLLTETDPFVVVSDKADVDEDGWILVTRRRPRKQSQAQLPPLCRRKRQGRKKSPCHFKGKEKSKNVKRHKILPIDLLEQEPLVPVILEEFFPTGFFEKVTVNMTSCSELEEDDDEGSDRQEESPRVADKTLTVLEALLARMGGGQIFVCLTRCANMLLLPYNTQNFTLIKSRMWKHQQKALFSVLLATP